ncbi:hypothetical protein ACOMHN_013646 [Nucella lapillus]
MKSSDGTSVGSNGDVEELLPVTSSWLGPLQMSEVSEMTDSFSLLFLFLCSTHSGFHPSFSAEECFQRVDKNLRSILTRRHLPLGLVSQLEREVVGFFTDCPGSVYVSHLASSFERLLLHAVCQYLGLCCQSFEEGGERRTHVENKNPSFVLPARSLAQFLERS